MTQSIQPSENGSTFESLSRTLILVTGPPRSGTTAVGSAIAKSKDCVSLHEPMNKHTGDKCINRYFELPGYNDFSQKEF